MSNLGCLWAVKIKINLNLTQNKNRSSLSNIQNYLKFI